MKARIFSLYVSSVQRAPAPKIENGRNRSRSHDLKKSELTPKMWQVIGAQHGWRFEIAPLTAYRKYRHFDSLPSYSLPFLSGITL